ncbi:MAG: transporter substrate-binding domain-containing protein [Candidatus Thermoplasmatota archaeon]|nr:transporter substrate-binding domain-containing protein [Candidatus Thermoplasmatota archaeon]
MKFSQIMSVVLVACLLVTSVPVSADHGEERYYRLGVQSGTTSDLYIADELPNAVASGFDTIDLAINALKIGDVDFVLGDLPTLKYYEADSDVLYVAGSFGAEDFGIGVAPGEQDLLAAIDVALTEIIDSGQYDVIFADTFGDEIVVLTDDTTSDTATTYPASPTGTLASVLNSEELVFGTDPYYPPFESYNDDDVVVGFDADIAEAIGARIATFYDQDLDVVMHEKTWDTLLAFPYDDYDATLSAMTKTAQRAENTDFSRAYYSSKQGIIGSEDSSVYISGVADLNGHVQYAEDDCPFTLANDDNPCNHSADNPCADDHESDECWEHVLAYCDNYNDPGCEGIDECPFELDNADNPCNDDTPCSDGAHESEACWDYVDDYCDEYDDPGCHDIGGPITFVCGNGEEIDFWFVNDGEEDCDDGSDEQQYDEFGDRINWFDCHDGSEVWLEQVNNGDEDCPDGEDEVRDYHDDDECPVDDEAWCEEAMIVCDEDSATHDNAACGTMVAQYCTENPDDDDMCADVEEWCGGDAGEFDTWTFRLGVQSGTTSDTYAADEIPLAEVNGFDTIDLAVNALKMGDVDFVLGDLPTLKYYETESDGLYVAASFGAEDFGIGVAPGEQDLLDAIDVALGEIIASGEYDVIFADTFGDEIVVLTDDTTSDTATAYPAEPSGTLEFALDSGVLVFGSDTTYPPFESLDDDGDCVGFDCDMADAIAARIATAYDQDLVAEMKTKTWDELLAFTYEDYDATLSAMTKTAQRAENTDFSRAYYSSKQGILASEESPLINGVEDLNGEFEIDEEELAFCLAYNAYEPPSELIVNSEENPDCYQNWVDNGNPVWSQGWTHFASNITVEWPANSGKLWYPEGGGLDPIGGDGIEPDTDGHWWACKADVDPSIEELVEDEVPSLTMLVSVLAIGLIAIARRRH